MNHRTHYLIFLILSFNSMNFYSQNSDTLFWNKTNKLKYDDFKSNADTINFKNIFAYSMLVSPINWYGKNDTIYIKIKNGFIKQQSFFIRGNKNEDDNLLSHEQGHFNIQEIELRRFIKALFSVTYQNYNQFRDYYTKQLTLYKERKKIVQKQYDSETDLSRNVVKQKEWNEKIAKELKELENYSNSIIKIPLKKK